jgi:RNA polymerase sigma-70 factor (ECF subfamily)
MNEQTSTQSYSLAALKAGDRAAFASMVGVHYELVYRLAIKMLGNPQDAEDVLQETFIKAFKHVKDFDGRSSLSTWLYRIATNEALMFLRRRNPQTFSIDEPAQDDGHDSEPLQIVDWCCIPEQELMSDEAQQYLDQATSRLPIGLRLVFVLRDIQGLSTRETGEVLDLTDTAVKTRLSRARLRLRNDLSGYYRERMPEERGA